MIITFTIEVEVEEVRKDELKAMLALLENECAKANFDLYDSSVADEFDYID